MYSNDEFYHSGVKGMKHGLRRYQYKDGSLTPLGRIHYGVGPARNVAKNIASVVANTARKVGSSTSKAVKKTATAIRDNVEEKRSDPRYLARKSSKKLSDSELKIALSRIEMEKKYKDIRDQMNPFSVSIRNAFSEALGYSVKTATHKVIDMAFDDRSKAAKAKKAADYMLSKQNYYANKKQVEYMRKELNAMLGGSKEYREFLKEWDGLKPQKQNQQQGKNKK